VPANFAQCLWIERATIVNPARSQSRSGRCVPWARDPSNATASTVGNMARRSATRSTKPSSPTRRYSHHAHLSNHVDARSVTPDWFDTRSVDQGVSG
jgi:hypothetical protein